MTSSEFQDGNGNGNFEKINSLRSFEKGLADRGGWREETLERPEIRAFFIVPFFDTFLENFWGSFWGFVCRQPPPFRHLPGILGGILFMCFSPS